MLSCTVAAECIFQIHPAELRWSYQVLWGVIAQPPHCASCHGEGPSCQQTFQKWCEPTSLFLLCSGFPSSSLKGQRCFPSCCHSEPSSGCCWDAASWGSQKHLYEPCHKNSVSPWKSLEMNSRIMRKGRILTSWSWVTAEKGQRQLEPNTAVGAAATVPECQCLGSCFTQPHAQLTPRVCDQ